MKKLVLATALVAAFSSQVMAAATHTSTVGGTGPGKATDGSDPSAQGGIVRFKGTVVDQTCTIDGNSQDQIITLDPVAKNRFTAPGVTAMPTQFHIKLLGCTLNDPTKKPKVKARFASVANVDIAHEYTLRNTKEGTSGGASNVNIRLYNADGTTPIYPMRRTTVTTDGIPEHKSKDDVTPETITVQDPTLTYVAKYYSTNANVGVGEVESAVDFELSYE